MYGQTQIHGQRYRDLPPPRYQEETNTHWKHCFETKIYPLALHPVRITLLVSVHTAKIVSICPPILPSEETRTISNSTDEEKVRKAPTQIRSAYSSTSPTRQGWLKPHFLAYSSSSFGWPAAAVAAAGSGIASLDDPG